MTERTLVTGGTGFLGQHLVRALRERGQGVRVLVRATNTEAARKLQSRGAELMPGDMLDPASVRLAVQGVARVYHLAGQLLIPGIAGHKYKQLHVEGTRNLLAACADAGSLRAIVHCSTTGVLGPTGDTPLDEDAPLRPSNVYERTKAEGEQLALEMARLHDLPLSVARPALVYGPGDLHLLGWFRAIQRGYYRVVGTGANLLHPIYIDDLTDGLLRCAQSPAAIGRIYHLVGERPVPIRELAAAIAEAMARRLPQWRIPLPIAFVIAALLESLPGIPPHRLPLTRNRVKFMTENRAYCGDRARRELGFAPQVDLPTGLGRAVVWYQQEGLL